MDVDRPGLFSALTSCSSWVEHGKLPPYPLVLGACHPSLPLEPLAQWPCCLSLELGLVEQKFWGSHGAIRGTSKGF